MIITLKSIYCRISHEETNDVTYELVIECHVKRYIVNDLTSHYDNHYCAYDHYDVIYYFFKQCTTFISNNNNSLIKT